MIIVAALGILAGTMTLVLASVVLRAGKGRPDNRLFAVMASVAGVVALSMAVNKAQADVRLCSAGIGTLGLIVEVLTAGMSVLFAYAFPRGRAPSRALWLIAGSVVVAGSWLAFGGELAGSARRLTPWLLLPPYALSVVLLLRQRRQVAAPLRAGLWAVAGILASRWLLGGVVAHHGLCFSPLPNLSLPADVVGVTQMLLIGSVILRYHLLDVRRVFRESAVAWVVALGVSVYAAFVLALAPHLKRTVGDQGTVLAVVLPLLLAAWVGWTWRDDVGAAARALDPHRGVRRELMERVLAVTGYVVDPEAVLSMIRAAMIEVFPQARVEFRRAGGSWLLQGISATLPAALEDALHREDAAVVDVPSLVQRHPALRDLWSDPSRRILLPVRRDAVLYGAFELVGGRADTDDLLTASAMADHLAVKLENVSLSSSLGQAGRELESIRTFLEDMIESLPVGIVGISGPDLEVRSWNPFEARRTGIPASEVLGKRYLEEVADRHVEQTIADAIRERPEEVLSFPNVGWSDQRGGNAVDVTVAPLRMRGESAHGYVLILVDTTERNALQREVEDFRRLAALGEFAAAIAHDIRTPLSSIRMSVQILRSKVELSPDDMEYFDLTLEAISRLGRDVEELLDFTKPAFLRVEAVALHEIAEDARDAVAAVSSDVAIELSVPKELVVPIDEAHMRKVLMNLLQNAVQASEPGSRVWLEAACDGDAVRIVVRDEGRGIEKEDLDRIWDPFFTTRTDGTGLGLAIVRKAVTAHGGSVSVESEPGDGTRFEVLLPARRETEVLVPIEEYHRQAEEFRQSLG